MNRPILYSSLLLALFAVGCRDLQCPRNSTRKGDTCTECEPGWWPKSNVCVKLADDAGVPGEGQEPVFADGGPAMTEHTIGVDGMECSKEGQRACDGVGSRGKLVCTDGVWKPNGTCDGDTLCSSAVGADQGACLSIAKECVGRQAGESYCADGAAVTCGADRLSATKDVCGANSSCAEKDKVASCECGPDFAKKDGVCAPFDDCASNPCGPHGTSCKDGFADFTCTCQGIWFGKRCEEQMVPLVQPVDVVLDSARNQLLIADNYVGLVALDLDTRRTSLLLNAYGIRRLALYSTATSPRNVALTKGSQILSMNLTTGTVATLTSSEEPLVGKGQEWAGINDLVYDASHSRFLVSVMPAYAPKILLGGFWAVNPTIGDRELISDQPEFGLRLALVPSRNYGLTSYAIANGASQLATVPLVQGAQPVTAAVGGVVLDQAGFAVNKAATKLFGFSTNSLVAVDLSTGASQVVASARSVEPYLLLPSSIELNETETTAYVADLQQESVLSFQLGNASRTAVADLSSGRGPRMLPENLAIASKTGELAVVDSQQASVFRVDSATGDRRLLASPTFGSGPAISKPCAVASEPDGKMLYVVDCEKTALVAVEPATGNRTVLARDESLASATSAGFSLKLGAVIVSTSNGAVRKYAVETGGLLGTHSIEGNENKLSIDTSGKLALLGGGVGAGSDVLKLLDLETGSLTIRQLTGLAPVWSQETIVGVAFDGSKPNTATVNTTKRLLTVDIATGLAETVASISPTDMIKTQGSLIVADPANHRVIAVAPLHHSVLTIDLTDGSRRVLSKYGAPR